LSALRVANWLVIKNQRLKKNWNLSLDWNEYLQITFDFSSNHGSLLFPLNLLLAIYFEFWSLVYFSVRVYVYIVFLWLWLWPMVMTWITQHTPLCYCFKGHWPQPARTEDPRASCSIVSLAGAFLSSLSSFHGRSILCTSMGLTNKTAEI
jgi:hypothetical protein